MRTIVRNNRLSCLLSILIFCFILTSCGNSKNSNSENESIQTSEIVGTGGLLIPIQSDNVRAAGYDSDSKIMTVQFLNGYTYEYYGIEIELWEDFVAAQPDPWSLVGYPRLVQAGVPYKRIS